MNNFNQQYSEQISNEFYLNQNNSGMRMPYNNINYNYNPRMVSCNRIIFEQTFKIYLFYYLCSNITTNLITTNTI